MKYWKYGIPDKVGWWCNAWKVKRTGKWCVGTFYISKSSLIEVNFTEGLYAGPFDEKPRNRNSVPSVVSDTMAAFNRGDFNDLIEKAMLDYENGKALDKIY